MNKVWKFVISILVSLSAGAIGGIFTSSAITTWYATLTKPSFNPPNWLFGPAWTVLYILMGIALYLVWVSDKENKKITYIVFFIQLVLNTLWSIVFFGAHQTGWAFFEIVLLWLAILATIIAFHRISKPAAYLLIPYVAWVTFAAILNYSVWVLN